MKLGGGEFSTGTMGNFQPELTMARPFEAQGQLRPRLTEERKRWLGMTEAELSAQAEA
jgi:hypothetical protein